MNLIEKNSLKFIFLLGLVSLFGDIIYEGARSIIGPFLSLLGASAVVVGLIVGLGEFFSYSLRLLSGYLADRTNRYWLMIFLGYGMLLAIPLLAWTKSWELACFLIILERIGKAIRTPARDAILSHVTERMGRGIGFGIHEALDQIGAIIGPLFLSFIFSLKKTYQTGFAFLFIPAIFLVIFLSLAKIKYPSFVSIEDKVFFKKEKISKNFWIYTLFSFFTVAGFINFQIISYHFKTKMILSDINIPVFYAIAMGVDAIFALLIGKVYDKFGLACLLILPFLNIFIPFFIFTSYTSLILVGITIWGSVMGIQETIMRAAVADITPLSKRGIAYGIFNTIYGLAWFLGGGLIGFLYEISLNYVILAIICLQIISLFLWWKIKI